MALHCAPKCSVSQERFKLMCNTRAFRDLDRNHDGRISRQELHDACQRWNLPTAAVDKVLQPVQTICCHHRHGHTANRTPALTLRSLVCFVCTYS